MLLYRIGLMLVCALSTAACETTSSDRSDSPPNFVIQIPPEGYHHTF